MPTDDLLGRLKLEHYPRSLGYDPRWVVENQMGPNPLWLMEALTNGLTLNPGARVLDLGAGTALTSIFLAKEFGVSVIAADLWVSPTENQRRVREAGVEALVLPLRLDSHDLRFGDETFDAILSVDAYHYFGTDDQTPSHWSALEQFFALEPFICETRPSRTGHQAARVRITSPRSAHHCRGARAPRILPP